MGRGYQIREAGKGQAMERPKAMGYSVGFLISGQEATEALRGSYCSHSIISEYGSWAGVREPVCCPEGTEGQNLLPSIYKQIVCNE